MIFLDTSAIYALADRSDPRHSVAVERFGALLADGSAILTHNYVLVESLALVQHRLGREAAVKTARSAARFEIAWIDSALHREAVRRFGRARGRRVSFVDETSFLIMKSRGIDTAFAFDADFAKRGFRLLGE